MDHFCVSCVSCLSVILSYLFLTALWSLAGIGSDVCDVFLCLVTFPYGVLG